MRPSPTEKRQRMAQAAIDGAQAMADYIAEGKAVMERTARLREARLARGAAFSAPVTPKATTESPPPRSQPTRTANARKRRARAAGVSPPSPHPETTAEMHGSGRSLITRRRPLAKSC
jgi:hypothetical protein